MKFKTIIGALAAARPHRATPALRAGRRQRCGSTGIWAGCTCRSTTARTGLLQRGRHRPHDQRRPRLGQHRAGRRGRLRHVRARGFVVSVIATAVEGRRDQARDVAAELDRLLGGLARRRRHQDAEGSRGQEARRHRRAIRSGNCSARSPAQQARHVEDHASCRSIPPPRSWRCWRSASMRCSAAPTTSTSSSSTRASTPAALRYADHGANIVGMTILTQEATIKNKPDLVRRFVRRRRARGTRRRRIRKPRSTPR